MSTGDSGGALAVEDVDELLRQKARENEEVVVRVHNDDVHTFDFVIATFREIGLSYESVS